MALHRHREGRLTRLAYVVSGVQLLVHVPRAGDFSLLQRAETLYDWQRHRQRGRRGRCYATRTKVGDTRGCEQWFLSPGWLLPPKWPPATFASFTTNKEGEPS